MREVKFEEKFPLTVEQLYIMFTDGNLMREFHEAQGNQNIVISDWADPAASEAGDIIARRELRYDVPTAMAALPEMITQYIGATAIHMLVKEWRPRLRYGAGEGCVPEGTMAVHSSTHFEGLPMVSSMNSTAQFVFLPCTGEEDAKIPCDPSEEEKEQAENDAPVPTAHIQLRSKLQLTVTVEFDVWGLQTIVEASAESGVQSGFNDFVSLAKRRSVEMVLGRHPFPGHGHEQSPPTTENMPPPDSQSSAALAKPLKEGRAAGDCGDEALPEPVVIVGGGL
eukprot:TRINITY_DN15342_c0_g1_i1.p1 TRINITY_DN15342_c0_g1~~TRINITY_DN15342_c0_g1_i1.p1  ORF type:complete len:289 (-),score=69.83 TRINITY_DN15342_c0_g1_i1:171-1013(-)